MRVYTKRAAKDYPEFGIKRGDTYYEWCHYRQKPQKSATYPKESQLTSDEDMAEAMRQFEALELGKDYDASDVRDIISSLEDCVSSLEDRLSNVPEGLQDSSPLNEKIENVSETISSLEDLADRLESAEEDEEEDTCGAGEIEECRAF